MKKNEPYAASPLYILGLDHEIDTLSWMLTKLEAIKENQHSVRDDIVQRCTAMKDEKRKEGVMPWIELP